MQRSYDIKDKYIQRVMHCGIGHTAEETSASGFPDSLQQLLQALSIQITHYLFISLTVTSEQLLPALSRLQSKSHAMDFTWPDAA